MPPNIEAVIAARIDRLAPAEREVLRHGAIEGRVSTCAPSPACCPRAGARGSTARCSAWSRSS